MEEIGANRYDSHAYLKQTHWKDSSAGSEFSHMESIHLLLSANLARLLQIELYLNQI